LIQGTWETIKVMPDGEGGLNIRGGVGAYNWEYFWKPVDSQLFQYSGTRKDPWSFFRFDADGYISFVTNEKGEISHMYSGLTSYERMAWYEDTALHILLFVLCLGAFGAFLWQEVIIWFTRWASTPPYEVRGNLDASRSRYLARLAASLACVLGGGIIIYLLALLLMDISWIEDYTPQQARTFLTTFMTFPMIFLGLSPFVLASTFAVWYGRYWTMKDRLYYTAVTVASLIALWQFNVWNVIGYRF